MGADGSRVGVCRSCGVGVRWAKSTAGRPAVEKLLTLAAELMQARARVAELEEQLGGMLDGDRPARTKPAGEAKPNGNAKPLGPFTLNVLTLAKEGSDPKAIALRLGAPPRRVSKTLWKLRRRGDLPKTESSQP